METELDKSSYIDLFGGAEKSEKKSETSKLLDSAFIKCASSFLDSFDERCSKLNVAVERHDVEVIRQMAHQLKGSLRTIGGLGIAKILEKMEESTGVLTKEEIYSLMNEVNERTPQFREELKKFIGELAIN